MSFAAGAFTLFQLSFAYDAPSEAKQVYQKRLERGKYLFQAASCVHCHTDSKAKGEPLAGGAGLKTKYGTFYAPNITPDEETGIGRWSDEDFVEALRHGIAPRDGIASEGEYYYPVFPYAAYTKMTTEDILAIKAYIFEHFPPVKKQNRPHEIRVPYNIRMALKVWRENHFRAGEFRPGPENVVTPLFNRGAYLVTAVAHCTECHTPRDPMGGMIEGKAMTGTPDSPEGAVPNIRFAKKTGIGNWSKDDLLEFLRSGMTPDGDTTHGIMEAIVNSGTSQLTDEDQQAIVEYISQLPPLENETLKAHHHHHKDEDKE